MRRTKTVLAVVAVMAAMFVALSAPALADDGHNHNGNNNHHNGWNNWDNNWGNDDHIIFVSEDDFDDFDFDDDFDDDDYPYFWGFYPYWG
jgi:hypothetical protein